VAAHVLIDLNKASLESYTASGGRQSSGKVAMALTLAMALVVEKGARGDAFLGDYVSRCDYLIQTDPLA
jgi:hypothetical protein